LLVVYFAKCYIENWKHKIAHLDLVNVPFPIL
jgi:hypothetical protein